MTPREDVYRTYWEFAAKRQEVFFARIEGAPQPWSPDPILNEYKFCCTYRACDRVSQYLIRNVIYDGVQRKPEDVIFRILLFKIFNQIGTWEFLVQRFGTVSYDNFEFERYAAALDVYRSQGHAIYNNAYMACATKAYGYDQKHRNHLALIRAMNHHGHIADKIVTAKDFEEVFELLRGYPLIGDFMAYQLATDINYSEVIDFDENDFTMVGPGSERGIRKCFREVGTMTPRDVILWMTKNQDDEFRRLGIKFRNLGGRSLRAIDCQGLFCETDKYCRVRFPELKSNRTRIKARLAPNRQPIDYFFPPKWKLSLPLSSEHPRRGQQSIFRLVA